MVKASDECINNSFKAAGEMDLAVPVKHWPYRETYLVHVRFLYAVFLALSELLE